MVVWYNEYFGPGFEAPPFGSARVEDPSGSCKRPLLGSGRNPLQRSHDRTASIIEAEKLSRKRATGRIGSTNEVMVLPIAVKLRHGT